MNEPMLQDEANSADLLKWLTNHTFTHALVMEPHSHLFFVDPVSLAFATDLKYGCGWSDTFWTIFNQAFAGKVLKHAMPWGIAAVNLTTSPKAPLPTNTLALSKRALSCTAEAPRDNIGRLSSAGGRAVGHQCTAVRDRTGDYLGPVPAMAKDSLESLILGNLAMLEVSIKHGQPV